jgi:Pyruvate/2-oxoacid:ferredoxin oxidoreductase gamma subunit
VTISHLRFGKTPIQSTYLIDAADYIACHNPAYVHIYDVLEGIKDGRHLRAQQPLGRQDMETKLPAAMRRPLPKKAQILHHRRGQDRRRSGAGRPHQHDHADRLLQSWPT